MKAFLIRIRSSNQGTLGYWIAGDFDARTIELPWKDNRPNISCIPAGIYKCIYRYSKKYKHHYHLTNVKGRSWVLTHSGNLAGSTEDGFKTHSHGCILMGKYHGKLRNQLAVLCSKPTLRKFINYMKRKPFELEVVDA